MNITFLIGNGFDLNYGLKTGYQDFYKHYMTLPESKGDLLANSIMEKPQQWSDLEIGLGTFFREVGAKDLKKFFDSKFRLEDALVNYLRNEQEKLVVKNQDALIAEFKKNIANFYNDFLEQDRQEYLSFLHSTGEISYWFVTFNYTNILDRIVEKSAPNNVFLSHSIKGSNYNDRIKPVLHIHGTLNDGFILGIDSEKQGSESAFEQNPRYKKFMIKKITNANLKNNKNETLEKVISDSRYICLYGLSIGETDESWWKQIAIWLNQNTNNRLVIYNHLGGPVPVSAGRRLALDDSIKDIFAQRAGIPDARGEKIYPRIIVLHNSGIFDFKNVEVIDALEPEVNRQEETVGAV